MVNENRADFKDRRKKLIAWNAARTVGLPDDLKTFRNYKKYKVKAFWKIYSASYKKNFMF